MKKAILFTAYLLFLSSCRSITFPEPRQENSTVLVLQVENQTSLPRRLVFRQGFYSRTFKIRANRERTISLVIQRPQQVLLLSRRASDQRIELTPPEGVVELWSEKILINSSGISLVEIEPEDRLAASEALLDQFGFYHWASYRAENFSPYMPRRFQGNRLAVSVDSDLDAQVWIDGVFWGTAPVNTQLPPGRHQLVYRDDETELFRTFIDVEAPGHFFYSLEDLEEAAPEQFRVVMGPFLSWGNESEDLDLGPLLQESLIKALEEIPRLELHPWNPGGAYSTAMDQAIHIGAELLLEGLYWSKDGELLIQSRLIDVRSLQLRDSSSFQSELGLDILSNLDAAAREISYSLDRVLPEEGGNYYVLQDDLSASMEDVEKVLALDYIDQRRLERPNSWAFGTSLMLWTPTLTLEDGTEITHQGYSGPYFSYERDFNQRLSLRSTLGMMPLFSYDENMGNQSALVLSLDMDMLYHISTSEQYQRYGGLGGSLKFRGNDSQGNHSFITFSPHLMVGTRIFLSDRISGHRRFWDIGAHVPFLPYTYSPHGEVDNNDLVRFHFLYGGKL